MFLLNLPLIVLAPAAPWRVPESSGEHRSLSLEAVGALLAVRGIGGLIYALTQGPGEGWTSPAILAAFLIRGLSLRATVPAERRRRAPMLKLALFASRQLDAINAVTTLVYDGLAAAGHLIAVETELKLGALAAASPDRSRTGTGWR